MMSSQSIKIIHFSDLHLGIESYGRTDPKTGLNDRLLNTLRCLDYLVNFAISQEVALVLFTGDAYRNQRPTPTAQREFAKRLKLLLSNRIRVVLLVGNHDRPQMEKQAHSLAVFDALRLDGLICVREPEALTVDTISGAVQIAALPYLPIARFREIHDEFGQPAGLLHDAARAFISDEIDALASRLNGDDPAILAAHVSLDEATVGSEENLMIGKEFSLPTSLFSRQDFDYVALGHIHKHQDLSRAGAYPPIVYAGSLERIDFGEEKDPKGFCLVALEKKNTQYIFVDDVRGDPRKPGNPLPAMKFKTIDISISETESCADIQERLVAAETNDAIVRASISVPASRRHELDLAAISGTLEDSYTLDLSIHTTEERQSRLPNVTEEDSVIKVLEAYLESNAVDKEPAEALLSYASRIISEMTEESVPD